jgi:hypothetical protein
MMEAGMVRAAAIGLSLAALALAGCKPVDSSDAPSDSGATSGQSVAQAAPPAAPAPAVAAAPPKAADVPQLTPEEARQCNFTDCPAATKVVTASAADGPYLACSTEALSNYTNTVLGFMSAGAAMGTGTPNLDLDTGEPQYAGETKQIIVNLRTAARVSSFDEAAARCQKGRYRMAATVLNFVKDRQSTWIADGSGYAYWVPTVELDHARPKTMTPR